MAETLLVYQTHVAGPDGTLYEARAVGDDMPGGGWQGWVEFLPLAGRTTCPHFTRNDAAQ